MNEILQEPQRALRTITWKALVYGVKQDFAQQQHGLKCLPLIS